MSLAIGDSVTITCSVQIRDGQGVSQTINLVDEAGTVKKIDGDHVYVQTQHGVHYLMQDKVTPAT